MISLKKAVIFDLDGLLADSEIPTFEICRKMLLEYGKDITLAEYMHTYCGRVGVKNMEHIVSHYELPITVQEGLCYISEAEKEYFAKEIPLKPGAKKLLRFLKENGIKAVLATSSVKSRADTILEQNGISDYFFSAVYGSDVKNGKPDPEIFLTAAKKANAKPEDCLVLEDSEAGISAAHAADIDVICIPDLKVPDEKYRKLAVATLKSLDEVIGKLSKA